MTTPPTPFPRRYTNTSDHRPLFTFLTNFSASLLIDFLCQMVFCLFVDRRHGAHAAFFNFIAVNIQLALSAVYPTILLLYSIKQNIQWLHIVCLYTASNQTSSGQCTTLINLKKNYIFFHK